MSSQFRWLLLDRNLPNAIFFRFSFFAVQCWQLRGHMLNLCLDCSLSVLIISPSLLTEARCIWSFL
ncbi:hypothetical protein Pfo_007949 [Paulownia fortunei]|nr:hypothetical protein Pfo_007949 [Paulownia fortunei]